jgi:hypothetical protein
VKRPDAVAYVVARRRDWAPPGRGLSTARARRGIGPRARISARQPYDAALAGLTLRIVCRGATEQQELRQLAGPLTQVPSNPVADHALRLAVGTRREESK